MSWEKAFCCLNCTDQKDCCGPCGKCDKCCSDFGCDPKGRGCYQYAFTDGSNFYKSIKQSRKYIIDEKSEAGHDDHWFEIKGSYTINYTNDLDTGVETDASGTIKSYSRDDENDWASLEASYSTENKRAVVKIKFCSEMDWDGCTASWPECGDPKKCRGSCAKADPDGNPCEGTRVVDVSCERSWPIQYMGKLKLYDSFGEEVHMSISSGSPCLPVPAPSCHYFAF